MSEIILNIKYEMDNLNLGNILHLYCWKSSICNLLVCWI